MGVDANVISASRIREELRNGKSLDGALKLGFSESFWAIFDGNITTLIVAVMLMGVFGPSNILSIIFGESTTGAFSPLALPCWWASSATYHGHDSHPADDPLSGRLQGPA